MAHEHPHHPLHHLWCIEIEPSLEEHDEWFSSEAYASLCDLLGIAA